jgi:hypothetical protein
MTAGQVPLPVAAPDRKHSTAHQETAKIRARVRSGYEQTLRRCPRSTQIAQLWAHDTSAVTASAAAPNVGGSARVLVNPPVSLNVMLE